MIASMVGLQLYVALEKFLCLAIMMDSTLYPVS